MAIGVDFLKGKRQKVLEKERILRLLNIGSIIVLIFYCLVVGATFSYAFKLNKESQQIDEEVSVKKTRINELKKIESQQILLKQRMAAINTFLSKKKVNYSKIIEYLQSIRLPGIEINRMDISEKGEITMSGSANNAVALSLFLEKLTSELPKSPFSKIVLSSTNRKEDGSYDFSFAIKD